MAARPDSKVIAEMDHEIRKTDLPAHAVTAAARELSGLTVAGAMFWVQCSDGHGIKPPPAVHTEHSNDCSGVMLSIHDITAADHTDPLSTFALDVTPRLFSPDQVTFLTELHDRHLKDLATASR